MANYTPITGSTQTAVRRVTGWNLAETSGTLAARVLLRDGGASGPIFADIRIATAGSSTTHIPGDPIILSGDCYVDVASGTIRGAIYGDRE